MSAVTPRAETAPVLGVCPRGAVSAMVAAQPVEVSVR